MHFIVLKKKTNTAKV